MPPLPSVQPELTAPIRVRGHFGELLQGRIGADGPLVVVSLPCPALWVDVMPAGQTAAPLIGPKRIAALCRALDLTPPPDPLPLLANMPPGGGAGSSTAGLVAIARALGFRGPPEVLARACALAEGASDPLMFPGAERLLFATRDGRVIRKLPVLPRFDVIGGFYGPVQTTRPADLAFPDIADLLKHWVVGMSVGQMAELTAVSARRTLALRGPAGDPTEGLAAGLGALGWLIAHTGNARGLIFAPGTIPDHAATTLAEAGFQGVLSFAAGGEA